MAMLSFREGDGDQEKAAENGPFDGVKMRHGKDH
jgi:hypothetical protein